jgi:hypothetical protein
MNQEVIQKIAQRHFTRTGNKNQIGSVQKVLIELMPDIEVELKNVQNNEVSKQNE